MAVLTGPGGAGGTPSPYPPQTGILLKKSLDTVPEHTHLLPRSDQFVTQVLERRLAGWDHLSPPPARLAPLKCAWSQAQMFLKSAYLDAYGAGRAPEVFYGWAERQQLSLDYVSKILRVLNSYGQFLSAEDNKVFIPIPKPKGFYRERIRDAARSSGRGKTSLPLSAALLSKARRRLSAPEYRWLFVSFYFGLRPSEVDALTDPAKTSIIVIDGIDVLRVFQSKLRALPPEKRWKHIPALMPEQQEALTYIREGGLSRPSPAKLQTTLGARITTYTGRKGFAGMILDNSLDLKAASVMLGHKSEETTRQHYADPVQVQLARIRGLIKPFT